MEGHEEISVLEELKLTISESPENIEREFAKAVNNWPACVGTRLSIMETYLTMSEEDGLVSAEEGQKAHAKIEAIKYKLLDLQKQYPEYTDEVPQEIKEEILSQLNILE